MLHGRGDEFRHGSTPLDPRGIHKASNIWDPTEHLDEIKAMTGDFGEPAATDTLMSTERDKPTSRAIMLLPLQQVDLRNYRTNLMLSLVEF
jgi:hypothetical protein